MGDDGVGVQDLRALDRDVARGVAALEAWRSGLRSDLAAHAGDDPLDAVRHVTGQSTWLALEKLDVSVADAPLRDALRRWVYFLLQARITAPTDVEWARGAAEKALVDRGESSAEVTWGEAWRGLVASSSASVGRTWLEAAATLAPRLGAAHTRRASRRVEVARRLGVAHPWAPLLGVTYAVLRETAARFLAATDDLWAATYREALRDGGGLAAVVATAVGREAGEGWPARLSVASLRDLLRDPFDGPGLEIPALPPALGAASFARGFYAVGFAARSARPSSSVPFVLAREPAFVAAHRFGFVMASLAADPAFQTRALGLGARVASAQARILTRTSLFEARLGAMRVLLGDDEAHAPRDLFDELTARTFGRSLDARLRGAWPAARDDEAARWLGLVEAQPMRTALRDRFDVDWFRNPHAWKELRGATLAREPADEAVARSGAGDLARAFEVALG